MTGQLILMRHGESEYNKLNKFAGWVDSKLTDTGKAQAEATGEVLKKAGFVPNIVYTSTLSRAIDTAKLALAKMGRPDEKLIQIADLMERHYGGATGWDKKETEDRLGEDGLKVLRRSYDIPPPVMDESHPYHPNNPTKGPKVIAMPPNGKGTEALIDVVNRVKPVWEKEILPRLQKDENILIAAHGNSLRALTMIVEKMTPEQVANFEMANGVPVKLDIESAPGSKEWQFKKRSIVTA